MIADRRVRFRLRTLFVAIAVVAGTTAIWLQIASLYRFDSSAWRQASPFEQRPRTPRSRMVDDLLARYNFRGWTKAEVIELLGKPDDWSGFEQWDMVYVLGLERGIFALDDEALGFKFDSRDRVAGFGVSAN